MADTPLQDLRLWQLISPSLPIGAYAYSAGLEQAVEQGWVRDEAGTQDWIEGQLRHNLAALDVPLLRLLHEAWLADDTARVRDLTLALQASRETAELLAEDKHLGHALARVVTDLGLPEAADWVEPEPGSLATLWALAAARWDIPLTAAARGYLWGWAENQVAAAIKIIPLGQSAGQRILFHAAACIPAAVDEGLRIAPDDIGATAPGVAMASAWHEMQYSRLFRS